MLKYRHTTLEDVPKIEEWIALDPAHAGKMTAADFVLLPDADGKITKGIQCIEVQDEKGVVFYLEFVNALIVKTQFPPVAADTEFGKAREQIRVARALKEAFGYFAIASKNLGYHAMLFDSVSESLVAFFEKLGFKKLVDYFKADL